MIISEHNDPESERKTFIGCEPRFVVSVRGDIFRLRWLAPANHSECATDIPMRRGDRMTFLRTDINGKQGYFLFDAGCTQTALSADQFGSLKRKHVAIKVHDADGEEISVDQVAAPTLDVPPFRLTNLPSVWLIDTTAVSEAVGVPIWGAIGGDCLLSRIVRVDPDAARISLLPSDTAINQDWGVSSDCVLHNSWMYILVAIGDQTVWCNIDTGSNGGLSLPWAIFDKVVAPGDVHKDMSATAGGMSSQRSAVLPEVQMLGSKVLGVSVDSTDAKNGSIGLGALSRFVLTIDYPHRRVFARPSRTFNEQDKSERFGIGWIRRNGQVMVCDVEQGSAAERAGAQPGDIVQTVNGRAIKSFKFLDEVSDVYSAKPPVCRFVVSRNNQTVGYAISPE